MILTKHLSERMAARDISRPTVEAVVRSGEVVEQTITGHTTYSLCGIVAVTHGDTVITVYRDGERRLAV